jgi:hypothetical protein
MDKVKKGKSSLFLSSLCNHLVYEIHKGDNTYSKIKRVQVHDKFLLV